MNKTSALTFLDSDAATQRCGARLAHAMRGRGVVFFEGVLGSGKTTFCRGMLRGLGHKGIVKSPTYTLLESYHMGPYHVHHFDLYRLQDPEEFVWIGGRECFQSENLCLIEWPSHGGEFLPVPDIRVELLVQGAGRDIVARSQTARGEGIVARFNFSGE